MNVFECILNTESHAPILIDTIQMEKTNADTIVEKIRFIAASLIRKREMKKKLNF